MYHGLHLLGDAFPAAASVFVTLDTGRPVSAIQVLLAGLLAPYRDDSQAGAAYSDLARVTRELASPSSLEDDYGDYLKVALRVLLSAAENRVASPASLEPLLEPVNVTAEDPQVKDLLTQLSGLIRDLQANDKAQPENTTTDAPAH